MTSPYPTLSTLHGSRAPVMSGFDVLKPKIAGQERLGYAGIVAYGFGQSSFVPVAVYQGVFEGREDTTFFNDFYFRIHINPDQLALGNIVSTQFKAVRVWNAYLTPVTLEGMTGMAEGLEVEGAPAPFDFKPLQALVWDVSVTPDGSPVIDTALTWNFGNGDTATLAITGNRIIAWAFEADWEDGVVERLSWATDILQSQVGVEQRRGLRLAPRRELEERFLVDGRERQLLDMTLFGWSGRVWAVPIRADAQLLKVDIPAETITIPCETLMRDFYEGGMVLLRGETAFELEVAEVAAITDAGIDLARPIRSAWPAGTRLYPARPGEIVEQPQLERKTDGADVLDVRFRLPDPSEWPAIMPTTLYRGYPVLEERPNESEDLTHAVSRLLLELDNGTGIPRRTDTAGRLFASRQHHWLLGGRAQRAGFRSLLYALQGRLKAVWVPTHAMDLTLVDTLGAAATALDVAYCGYTRFAHALPGRRDVRIELRNGTAIHRRVTGSTVLNDATERLTVDEVFTNQITPDQVLRMSWLLLCRLDQDAIELHHLTDGDGVATAQVMFKEVRDDEF